MAQSIDTPTDSGSAAERQPAVVKLTKAQHLFVLAHKPGELLSRWDNYKTYDFVGRVRDTGMIMIIDGNSRLGWPYGWEGTHLTAAGADYVKAHTK